MPQHNCPACDNPGVRYDLKTCGAPECMLEWKSWPAPKRARRLARSKLPFSERMLLDQEEEAENRERGIAAREQMDEALAEYNTKQERSSTPKFIRDMVSPSNLKGGTVPDATNELPESQATPQAGSRSSELPNPYTTNEGLPLEPAEEDPIDLKEQP